MNTIIVSVDKLYDKNVEYINLPTELDEVEKKLNHLKSESEKNERLAKESEEKKDNWFVLFSRCLLIGSTLKQVAKLLNNNM